MILELAVFHPDSVITAQECGADRIELCTNYEAGGISPDMEFFDYARKNYKGPVFVMIRPRAGNFEYSKKELTEMQHSIRKFDAAGADGFVLGCLKEKCVDTESLEILIKIAGSKPVTFHRAIDEVSDYETGIKTLISSGCSRVLSSGMASSATAGRNTIAETIKQFGQQITFLAGGGVRSNNVELLMKIPGLQEIHSACIDDQMELANPEEVARLLYSIKRNPISH